MSREKADLFTEKYAPQSFEEFVGNGPVLKFVKEWAELWNQGRAGKPLLLHGAPGTGKTCLAYLTAKIFGWQVFELNASDLRNKKVIERIVAAAAFNSSFSGSKRLVLLDEVDGLQSVDRGGASAILNVLKQSQNPVILTANKIYSSDRKLDSIKAYCEALKFSKIMSTSIAKRLRQVCEKEKIDYDLESLKALAQSASGDLRAALLDLQNLSALRNKITLEDIESAGYREREEEIFNVLNHVFKSRDAKSIRRLKAATDIDFDLLKKWVEENIPRVYRHKDTEQAFHKLSKADIFDGRIMRRQHWGFLRYSSELMTSGVALAKENDYRGWLQLQFPLVLKKLSSSKGERALKQGIARKIAEKMHSSAREIIKSDLPFYTTLFKNKELAAQLIAQFDLDEKEAAFILGSKPETKKVQKLLEQAKELKLKQVKPKKIPFEAKEEEAEEQALQEKLAEEKTEQMEIDEKQTSLGGFVKKS